LVHGQTFPVAARIAARALAMVLSAHTGPSASCAKA
jgi:hypothetical protein